MAMSDVDGTGGSRAGGRPLGSGSVMPSIRQHLIGSVPQSKRPGGHFAAGRGKVVEVDVGVDAVSTVDVGPGDRIVTDPDGRSDMGPLAGTVGVGMATGAARTDTDDAPTMAVRRVVGIMAG